jgi:phosphatidylglycerophosphate synthase
MPGSSFDGPVSRYLNRPFSRLIARTLAPTPVTPNQVSVAAFLIAIAALISFIIDQAIVAGVLIQTSSIVDGADGDLARLQKRESRFGAVFDAALDRYADAAIAGGMALWAWSHGGVSPEHAFSAGLAALTGFLLVSYSRARMEQEGFARLLGGPALLASRDIRLIVAAVGSAFGQAYWTLLLLAALSYIAIAWRVATMYLNKDNQSAAT